MIHLDRNHHPSPLTSSNLILPSVHADPLKLLSRSPLTHDDKPVVQQESLPTVASNTTVDEDKDVVANPATVDRESHSPAPAFPDVQKSSPLSPPSDSGSPKLIEATSPPVVPEDTPEQPASETAPEPSAQAEELVATEDATSPLSELTSAPEQEDDDDKLDNPDQGTTPAETADAAATAEEAEVPTEMAEERKVDESSEHTLENTSPAAIAPKSPSAAILSAASSGPKKRTSTSEHMSTDPAPADDQRDASKSPMAPAKSPAKSPAPEPSSSQEPHAPSPQPSSSDAPALSKDKAVRLLELNGELLKCVHSIVPI
jgi:hypothetical protein